MAKKLDYYVEKNSIDAPGRSYLQAVGFKKKDNAIIGYYFNDDDISSDYFGLALTQNDYGDVSISFFNSKDDNNPLAYESWNLDIETNDYPYTENNQKMNVFDILEWCVHLEVIGVIPYHGMGMDYLNRIDELPDFLLKKMSHKVIKEMTEDLNNVLARSRRGEIDHSLLKYYFQDFYVKGLYHFLNKVLK